MCPVTYHFDRSFSLLHDSRVCSSTDVMNVHHWMWDSALCCDICPEGEKVHCAADDPDTAQHGIYTRKEKDELSWKNWSVKQKQKLEQIQTFKGKTEHAGALVLSPWLPENNFSNHKSSELHILVSSVDEMCKIQSNLEAKLIKIYTSYLNALILCH